MAATSSSLAAISSNPRLMYTAPPGNPTELIACELTIRNRKLRDGIDRLCVTRRPIVLRYRLGRLVLGTSDSDCSASFADSEAISVSSLREKKLILWPAARIKDTINPKRISMSRYCMDFRDGGKICNGAHIFRRGLR